MGLPAQWRRTDAKTCTKCGGSKPLKEFYWSAQGYPSANCKACTNRGLVSPRGEWAVTGKKTCSRCRKTKPIEEFGISRNKSEAYPRSCCKVCAVDVTKLWAKKQTTEKRLLVYRRHQLKKKYGISLEQYDQMLALQNGRCGVCESVSPRGKPTFAVDHCHDTGRVRGLLCGPCNQAIGLLGDNEKLLFKAIQYLKGD
jgi:hypothetical protein